MANAFSSICEMNLMNPPQPCSSHRSHRVEFQFSDQSRFQVFVCARHAETVSCIEKALKTSREFPPDAYLVSTQVRELHSSAPLAPCAGLAIAVAK